MMSYAAAVAMTMLVEMPVANVVKLLWPTQRTALTKQGEDCTQYNGRVFKTCAEN